MGGQLEPSDLRFLPSSPRARSFSETASPSRGRLRRADWESPNPYQSDTEGFVVGSIPLVLTTPTAESALPQDVDTLSWKRGTAQQSMAGRRERGVRVFQFDGVSPRSTPEKRGKGETGERVAQFRGLVESIRKLQVEVCDLSLNVKTVNMRIQDYTMQIEKLRNENIDIVKLNAATKYDHVGEGYRRYA